MRDDTHPRDFPPDNQSDEDLLRQMQDFQAKGFTSKFNWLFEILWRRYEDPACSLAAFIGGGNLRQQDCFDVAQDVGFKIFKWIRRPRSTLDANFVFKKFFNRCVRDQTISALRKLKTKRKHFPKSLGDWSDDTNAVPSSLPQIEASDELAWLLEGCEPYAAMVFTLYHSMELTLMEISEELDLPVGRVHRLLQRARKHIQRRYRD